MADMNIEEIRKQEAELKARKEEQAKIAKELKEQEKKVKAARKAYEKKVTEIANKEIELESSYIELEHSIKGTNAYSELVTKIATLEEEIRTERKELGMMNLGYDGQATGKKEYEYVKLQSKDIILPNNGYVRKEIEKPVVKPVEKPVEQPVVKQVPAKEELTDEEKKEIAILLQGVEDIQSKIDAVDEKDREEYKYTVQTAAQKALIVRVFHNYRDKLNIDEDLLSKYMMRQYKTLKDSLDINKLLIDNNIQKVDVKSLNEDERIKYEKELEEITDQGVRVFATNKIDKEVQETKDKKNVLAMKLKGDLQNALDEKQLLFLYENGYDLNYVHESSMLTKISLGREFFYDEKEDVAQGYILRQEPLADKAEPRLKAQIPEAQRKLMAEYRKAFAEKQNAEKNEIANSENRDYTLTIRETMESAKNASIKIIDKAETEAGDPKEPLIDKWTSIVESKNKLLVFNKILQTRSHSILKGFDIDVTKYGITLEKDTMAGRSKAIKQMQAFIKEHEAILKTEGWSEKQFDEIAESSIYQLQVYNKAHEMMKHIEDYESKQKVIDGIEDYESFEKEKDAIEGLGLTRTKLERASYVKNADEYKGKEVSSLYEEDLMDKGLLINKDALSYVIEDGFEPAEIQEKFEAKNGAHLEQNATGFISKDGEIAYAKDYLICEEDFVKELVQFAENEADCIETEVEIKKVTGEILKEEFNQASQELKAEFAEEFNVEQGQEQGQDSGAEL